MPTESELRSFLQETGPADASRRMPLDASSIVRRARRRRLPKQLALGGTVTLAAAGIGIASIQGLQLAGGSSSTAVLGSAPDGVAEPAPGTEEAGTTPGSADGDDLAASGDEIRRAPASRINFCGGALAEVAPSVTGLELSTEFPDGAPADGSPVTGVVTLANTGTERVSGTTSATPAITLSQDGIVLWHTNGPEIAMAMMVDLDPGESMQYGASFTPVRCEAEDDSGESFRDNLPPLTAGTYELSAALDIMLDVPVNGSPEFELITGPLESVSMG